MTAASEIMPSSPSTDDERGRPQQVDANFVRGARTGGEILERMRKHRRRHGGQKRGYHYDDEQGGAKNAKPVSIDDSYEGPPSAQ